MIGVVAALVEAYGEFRVSKLRILLSLVGVAVSVFAMTMALGAGAMLDSATRQSTEKTMGRASTLTLTATNPSENTSSEEVDAVAFAAFDRLGITQRSRKSQYQTRVQSPSGVVTADVRAVDPDYATLFRVRPSSGRWLADKDGNRLVPSVVLGERLYERLGRPRVGNGVVQFYPQGARKPVMATLVGVVPVEFPGDPSMWAYITPGAVKTLLGSQDSDGGSSTEYLAWVPPDMAAGVKERLNTQLASTPAGSFEVMDNPTLGDESVDMLRKATLAVAAALLLLGALGLVNISLVTVRHRMREIGIRRSYGATSGRIFFGVMLESVVATTIAGVVGVGAAVFVVNSSFVRDYFRQAGIVDWPPFPISAVLIGFATAIGVGVLAGAVPAIIATRIKVIDAIRA